MAWTCPKCRRRFEKTGQTHSCAYYPLERHFKGKDEARALFRELKLGVREAAGPFRVESLPCCIHLVKGTNTFAAVFARREKLLVTFALGRKAKAGKARSTAQLSKSRYKHVATVSSKKDINKQLLGWLKESVKG